MKLIRANKGIYVPADPESKADLNLQAMRLVQTGLVALIPDNFNLPEDSHKVISSFQVKENHIKIQKRGE